MSAEVQEKQIGYTWWKVYSFLFIIPNLLFMVPFWMGFFNTAEFGISGGFIAAAVITVALMLTWLVYLLSMNKYAFLTATMFSLNPIFWIINGVYLKNRWQDVEKFKQSSQTV